MPRLSNSVDLFVTLHKMDWKVPILSTTTVWLWFLPNHDMDIVAIVTPMPVQIIKGSLFHTHHIIHRMHLIHLPQIESSGQNVCNTLNYGEIDIISSFWVDKRIDSLFACFEPILLEYSAQRSHTVV